MKILESLERLAELEPVQGTGSSSSDVQRVLEEARKDEDNPRTKLNDLRSYIQLLHASLAQHCMCGSANERTPILANIRLNCHDGLTDAQVEDQTVNFSLLFLSHPHSFLSPESHRSQWRDTQICVHRKRLVDAAYLMTQPLKFANFGGLEQSELDLSGRKSPSNPFAGSRQATFVKPYPIKCPPSYN